MSSGYGSHSGPKYNPMSSVVEDMLAHVGVSVGEAVTMLDKRWLADRFRLDHFALMLACKSIPGVLLAMADRPQKGEVCEDAALEARGQKALEAGCVLADWLDEQGITLP